MIVRQRCRSRPAPGSRLRIVCFRCCLLFVQIGSLIAHHNNDHGALMFWWALNMWTWSGVAWLQLIIFWYARPLHTHRQAGTHAWSDSAHDGWA